MSIIRSSLDENGISMTASDGRSIEITTKEIAAIYASREGPLVKRRAATMLWVKGRIEDALGEEHVTVPHIEFDFDPETGQPRRLDIHSVPYQLTEDKSSLIFEAFEELWKNKKCHRCGSVQWELADTIFDLSGRPTGQRRLSVPMVAISCGNCGITELLNAIVLGLEESFTQKTERKVRETKRQETKR